MKWKAVGGMQVWCEIKPKDYPIYVSQLKAMFGKGAKYVILVDEHQKFHVGMSDHNQPNLIRYAIPW